MLTNILLTQKGYELLSEELRTLITVRRPQVKKDLVTAREFGDLRENAEYDTAKRDQGMTEGRIHELETLLSEIEIIVLPEVLEVAVIGASLKVENLDANQQRDYTLVTEQEAHLDDQYLSVQSPLGQALMGSKVGETVTFQAPAGPRRFKIIELYIAECCSSE